MKEKPHILLLLTKWWGGIPNSPTPDIDQQLSLLEVTGLATIEKLYYDEYRLNNNCPIDLKLFNLCFETKPDLIVIALFPSDLPGGMYTPNIKTLDIIKNHLNIPVVAIMTDSTHPIFMKPSELIEPFVSLIVVLDSSTAYLRMTSQPNKYLPMWSPRDPRIFEDRHIERDIDISFIGGIADYPDRRRKISSLMKSNIAVYQTGGAKEAKLLIEEYANLMMRSKISLNFACMANHEGVFQLKGRVIEVMLSGAMLLEEENPEIKKWFEPMVDYVPFENEADLVEKARYYIAHDAERIEIAARGHLKTKDQYSGERFWKTVLGKVGILMENTNSQGYLYLNSIESSKDLMEQIIDLNLQLQKAEKTITLIQLSKFWKLRKIWFNFKKTLGLSVDNPEGFKF